MCNIWKEKINLSPDGEHFCWKSSSHKNTTFANMHLMQQNGQLCDVIINICDKQFPAHRLVLASVSQYFNAMFTGGLKEQYEREVAINNVAPSTFEILLNFAYTGSVITKNNNLKDLIEASDLFLIDEVKEVCFDFMMELITIENCFDIKRFADTHNCERLYKKAHSYALVNFQSIARTKGYLLLSISEVRELIADDELDVTSEEATFNAVMEWIKYDLSNRKDNLSELMEYVRFSLINDDVLLKTITRECTFLSNDIETVANLLDISKQASEKCSSKQIDRKPKRIIPQIFVIGGRRPDCEVYNPRQNSWCSIAPMQRNRWGHGMIAMDKKLLVFGGRDDTTLHTTAECYDPIQNTWTYTKGLTDERRFFGICSIDSFIYVCGGCDKRDNHLSSMEKYDPFTGIWYSCPSMITERVYFKTVVVDGSIYSVGGSNYNTHLESVERFDPREGLWTPSSSMLTRRCCHGVTVLDYYIYCTGGYDGSSLCSGERCDIRMNRWERIPDMLKPRDEHELATLEGYVYALGGHSLSPLNSVETFNPTINEWTPAVSMDKRRKSFGCVVLDTFQVYNFTEHL